MINIKIPAPSMKSINALIEKNYLQESNVLDEYMAMVANTLNYIGASVLHYQNECFAVNSINAEIDPKTLPIYSDIVENYSDIDFEGNLISRIKKINEVSGGGCPLATTEDLNRDISTWNNRWVTAYIWTLLCCEHIENGKLNDKLTINALLLELEGNTIS